MMKNKKINFLLKESWKKIKELNLIISFLDIQKFKKIEEIEEIIKKIKVINEKS